MKRKNEGNIEESKEEEKKEEEEELNKKVEVNKNVSREMLVMVDRERRNKKGK